MGYRQLTQAQRYQISAFLRVGRSQRSIAQELNYHSSTISRELHRNRSFSRYEPAQTRTENEIRLLWSMTDIVHFKHLTALALVLIVFTTANAESLIVDPFESGGISATNDNAFNWGQI